MRDSQVEGGAVGSMPLDRRGQKSLPVDGPPAKGTRLLHRLVPEQVGPPDCPIMFRWTLLGSSGDRWRLMLHRFPPNADDRDPHDHPCSFATLVLAGGYDDLVPFEGSPMDRRLCELLGLFSTDGALVVGERMRRGSFAIRRAEHKHRTRAGSGGCWSLVLMAPRRREWGFWKGGKWFQWKDYERRFGFGMRCE